ncbi:hypothetical protein HOLleu_11439 [Holothuria leucospilota]|uniref:Thioredoxin-like fold domain-containing protein n=1 Tax=Holothuria leucospilota TaxID=206669 RepID=A0A9Q1CG56_HOLLE|nr:hypothetical protein HOLleu_11439 [Holothuria leucospilota]
MLSSSYEHPFACNVRTFSDHPLKDCESSPVSGSVFGLCVSIAPIPRGTQGQGFPYSRSACDAKVEIDVFLDLTCPDSKAAFPVLKQVADHFGDQVALQSYMFPLPYHRASYLACRGTFAVDGFNNNLTYQWMKTVFDNQGTLYNSRTANIGDDQVSAILGGLAAQVGMKSDDFIKKSALNDNSQRIQWKYGCSRGVSGTPTALVNGVDVNMSAAWTLDNWIKIIQPLL